MDEQEKFQLIVNLVTALLFIISELLGLSKCQSNGIIDFLYKSIRCGEKPEDVKEPKIVVSESK